jgi:hypothetical protein
MEEMGNAYKIFKGKPTGTRQIERNRCVWYTIQKWILEI